ncbi:glycoside hydrolase family protein [Aestuariibaculum lutulentum]|uniref:Glycoside hydrolase family protein n=1 Tax=Aestuariibaculum lutulentum TaxID=2920935 RepID=A0ABS9RFN2_9FLAO|nr:glycoside hydrolase family protein [Aestuariibaculum lutulentum]MCH4551722.1 glycoside hydrolase family protein [Aestuariibaculum lutulentum]
MKRKEFIATGILASLGSCLTAFGDDLKWLNQEPKLSDFEKRLSPVGRALEFEDYYVWCNSPIEAPDGKIHVFFSRWPKAKSMSGWTHASEIAHAVADKPEGPYTYVSTVLAPRGEGFWDATTCHNPSVHFVDGKYALFFMGNSNGKLDTQRIGLATADSLYGPWKRPDEPLLLPGKEGEWDDHCTTNPSFFKHPNGEYWLYYKSFDTEGYIHPKFKIRGNRKYGLAISKSLEGPYEKYEGNPVIDFHTMGNNEQCEDAFTWYDGNMFHMLARDLGVYGIDKGLYMSSRDGKVWSEPEIGYQELSKYIQQPPAPKHLNRYGRAERPQVLFQNGKPTYLFTASQGGKYETASAFIFKIN